MSSLRSSSSRPSSLRSCSTVSMPTTSASCRSSESNRTQSTPSNRQEADVAESEQSLRLPGVGNSTASLESVSFSSKSDNGHLASTSDTQANRISSTPSNRITFTDTIPSHQIASTSSASSYHAPSSVSSSVPENRENVFDSAVGDLTKCSGWFDKRVIVSQYAPSLASHETSSSKSMQGASTTSTEQELRYCEYAATNDVGAKNERDKTLASDRPTSLAYDSIINVENPKRRDYRGTSPGLTAVKKIDSILKVNGNSGVATTDSQHKPSDAAAHKDSAHNMELNKQLKKSKLCGSTTSKDELKNKREYKIPYVNGSDLSMMSNPEFLTLTAENLEFSDFHEGKIVSRYMQSQSSLGATSSMSQSDSASAEEATIAQKHEFDIPYINRSIFPNIERATYVQDTLPIITEDSKRLEYDIPYFADRSLPVELKSGSVSGPARLEKSSVHSDSLIAPSRSAQTKNPSHMSPGFGDLTQSSDLYKGINIVSQFQHHEPVPSQTSVGTSNMSNISVTSRKSTESELRQSKINENAVETRHVLETRPAVETRPILKRRPVVETRPILETRPVVETKSVLETRPVVDAKLVLEIKPVSDRPAVTYPTKHSNGASPEDSAEMLHGWREATNKRSIQFEKTSYSGGSSLRRPELTDDMESHAGSAISKLSQCSSVVSQDSTTKEREYNIPYIHEHIANAGWSNEDLCDYDIPVSRQSLSSAWKSAPSFDSATFKDQLAGDQKNKRNQFSSHVKLNKREDYDILYSRSSDLSAGARLTDWKDAESNQNVSRDYDIPYIYNNSLPGDSKSSLNSELIDRINSLLERGSNNVAQSIAELARHLNISPSTVSTRLGTSTKAVEQDAIDSNYTGERNYRSASPTKVPSSAAYLLPLTGNSTSSVCLREEVHDLKLDEAKTQSHLSIELKPIFDVDQNIKRDYSVYDSFEINTVSSLSDSNMTLGTNRCTNSLPTMPDSAQTGQNTKQRCMSPVRYSSEVTRPGKRRDAGKTVSFAEDIHGANHWDKYLGESLVLGSPVNKSHCAVLDYTSLMMTTNHQLQPNYKESDGVGINTSQAAETESNIISDQSSNSEPSVPKKYLRPESSAMSMSARNKLTIINNVVEAVDSNCRLSRASLALVYATIGSSTNSLENQSSPSVSGKNLYDSSSIIRKPILQKSIDAENVCGRHVCTQKSFHKHVNEPDPTQYTMKSETLIIQGPMNCISENQKLCHSVDSITDKSCSTVAEDNNCHVYDVYDSILMHPQKEKTEDWLSNSSSAALNGGDVEKVEERKSLPSFDGSKKIVSEPMSRKMNFESAELLGTSEYLEQSRRFPSQKPTNLSKPCAVAEPTSIPSCLHRVSDVQIISQYSFWDETSTEDDCSEANDDITRQNICQPSTSSTNYAIETLKMTKYATASNRYKIDEVQVEKPQSAQQENIKKIPHEKDIGLHINVSNSSQELDVCSCARPTYVDDSFPAICVSVSRSKISLENAADHASKQQKTSQNSAIQNLKKKNHRKIKTSDDCKSKSASCERQLLVDVMQDGKRLISEIASRKLKVKKQDRPNVCTAKADNSQSGEIESNAIRNDSTSIHRCDSRKKKKKNSPKTQEISQNQAILKSSSRKAKYNYGVKRSSTERVAKQCVSCQTQSIEKNEEKPNVAPLKGVDSSTNDNCEKKNVSCQTRNILQNEEKINVTSLKLTDNASSSNKLEKQSVSCQTQNIEHNENVCQRKTDVVPLKCTDSARTSNNCDNKGFKANRPSFVGKASYSANQVNLCLDTKGPNFDKEFCRLMQQMQEDEGFSENDLESVIWFLWHQREDALGKIREWERTLELMGICSGSVGQSLKSLKEDQNCLRDEVSELRLQLCDMRYEKDMLDQQIKVQVKELMRAKCCCDQEVKKLQKDNAMLTIEIEALHKLTPTSNDNNLKSCIEKFERLQQQFDCSKAEIQELTRVNRELQSQSSKQSLSGKGSREHRSSDPRLSTNSISNRSLIDCATNRSSDHRVSRQSANGRMPPKLTETKEKGVQCTEPSIASLPDGFTDERIKECIDKIVKKDVVQQLFRRQREDCRGAKKNAKLSEVNIQAKPGMNNNVSSSMIGVLSGPIEVCMRHQFEIGTGRCDDRSQRGTNPLIPDQLFASLEQIKSLLGSVEGQLSGRVTGRSSETGELTAGKVGDLLRHSSTLQQHQQQQQQPLQSQQDQQLQQRLSIANSHHADSQQHFPTIDSQLLIRMSLLEKDMLHLQNSLQKESVSSVKIPSSKSDVSSTVAAYQALAQGILSEMLLNKDSDERLT